MHVWTMRLFVVALLLLLAGCDMNEDKPTETLEQGTERARAYVEDTMAAAAHDLEVKPQRRADPGACDNDLGMDTGTFRDGYSVKIALNKDGDAERLFEATAEYWETKGYAISFENGERGQPVGDDAVVAVEMGNGYYGALELFPSRGNAYLGISTPCLPKGADDSGS